MFAVTATAAPSGTCIVAGPAPAVPEAAARRIPAPADVIWSGPFHIHINICLDVTYTCILYRYAYIGKDSQIKFEIYGQIKILIYSYIYT